jgi:hypothetical protein
MQQSSCWEDDGGLHTQDILLNVQNFAIHKRVHKSKPLQLERSTLL